MVYVEESRHQVTIPVHLGLFYAIVVTFFLTKNELSVVFASEAEIGKETIGSKQVIQFH